MKRSQINRAIEIAIEFFNQRQFPLPSFAYWSPKEWLSKGHEYDEIRETRIGWDVSDAGSNDFENIGRTIFTLRNGKFNSSTIKKTYAHKVMCLAENQRFPVHFHKNKMEDIINQGGGNILLKFWNVNEDLTQSEGEVILKVDGELRKLKAGEELRLYPGESVCVVPRTYHQFWAEDGKGKVLSAEVSSICDDLSDNCWLEKAIRFPTIDEDEEKRHLLCFEYSEAK